MFQITLDSTSADRLEALADAWDYQEPLEKAGQTLMASFKRNFDAQGRPRWQPLCELTLANRKARGYGGNRVLEASGKLKRSVTQKGSEGNIWRLSSNSLELGTSVLGATIHQFGTRVYPGHPLRATRAMAMRIMTSEFDFDDVYVKTVQVASKTGAPRPFIAVQPFDLVTIAENTCEWVNRQIHTILGGTT